MHRSAWVDVARGIGILLVVLGHVWRGLDNAGIVGDSRLYETVDKFIYLFHMPLFFVLSGLFFQHTVKKQGIAGSFVNRLETLLYPLILWSYVTALFLFFAGSLTNRAAVSIVELLTYPFPPRDIFWFIWTLFKVQTVVSLFVLMNSRFLMALLAGAVVLLAVTLVYPPPPLLGEIAGSAIWNFPLFVFGMLIGRIGSVRNPAPKGPVVLIVLAVAAFVAAELWMYVYPTTFRTFSGFAASIVATVGVCYLIARLTPFLPARLSSGLEFLGRISMTIFLTHVFFFAATRIVLSKLGVEMLLVHVVAGVTAGVVGSIAVFFIARKLHLLRILALGRDIRAVEPDAQKQAATA